ncbi:MAG: helix-turn-helix transcriptional regulator [Lachnospiraceae bacterium]|nr:helix-turn-helix transcriptional regulator [Lachnospiraceae bacterium]
MLELNVDIIINNVKSLMKEHNCTQDEFAERIGTTQSNLSKFLNQTEDKSKNITNKMLTVVQLYNISQEFNVSLDWLIANKEQQKISTSNQSIAAFIAMLYENGQITFKERQCEETITQFIQDRTPYDLFPYNCLKGNVTYYDIHFPQYEHTHPELESSPDYIEYLAENGNDIEENIILNKFFEGLIRIQKLKSDNLLTDEQYELLKQNLIENTKVERPDITSLLQPQNT